MTPSIGSRSTATITGLPAVSPETTSYCEARQRLPEELAWDLVRRTGPIDPASRPKSSWLFHGRAVKIVDGSTVTMPDTPENQAAYPQPKTQAPGLGFPIARILVVFSLAVGTVLEAAIGPYQGKQTSELALLRQVIDQFQARRHRPGRPVLLLVLGDRGPAGAAASTWWSGCISARKADFRRGRRLGREDHLVTWTKPAQRPRLDEPRRVRGDARRS